MWQLYLLLWITFHAGTIGMRSKHEHAVAQGGLGRVVLGDYKGSVQPPGSYSFTVDGTNLPDGTYYARITTPLGETRMLKLVKE